MKWPRSARGRGRRSPSGPACAGRRSASTATAGSAPASEGAPVLGASHPLRAVDNVVCTPHLGYVERDGLETMFGTIFDQMLAYASGKPINVVNPEVLG